MVPDSVLNSVMTAALHEGTLISFRRVLLVHSPGRLAWSNPKSGESHVEKTKGQPEDRSAGVALPEPERCGGRYRGDGDLYRGAWGSRSAAGTVFLDLHGRPAGRGGLAESVPHRDGSASMSSRLGARGAKSKRSVAVRLSVGRRHPGTLRSTLLLGPRRGGWSTWVLWAEHVRRPER